MIEGLAHVGIAVKSLDEGIAFFKEKFGAEHDASIGKNGRIDFGLHTSAIIRIGTLVIELMEPAQEGEGPVGKFIAERGEGIHHISLKVDNYKESKEDFEKKGMRIIGDLGVMGFIHPKSAMGSLVEITEF